MVACYKISMQKLIVFLYNGNEQTKNDVKKNVPFTIAFIRVKYLGIN